MRIKFTLAIISLFFFSFISFSQQYTHIYYLNEGFASVQETKAVFLCKGYYDNGNFILDCFERKTGTLVLSASFTDSSIATLNGFYKQYYAWKKIQTSGYYRNNQKHGVWEDWNEEGQKKDSAYYDNGVKLRYARYVYLDNYNKSNNGIYSYSYNDSLANNKYAFFYSDSGTLSGEMKIIGNNEVWTTFSKDGNNSDTVLSKVEIEAEFPGGNTAWAKYLEKSLGSFSPMDYGAGNGKWQVIVKFIVDKDGTISNVTPETNFGHKMEEAVIKIIKNGPKWKPAIHNGKSVKALRRQPVTFFVEGM